MGGAQEEVAKARHASDAVEFDDKGGWSKAGDEEKGRKPVVPFHGKVDQRFLTHKQKRMIQKRAKKDSVVQGEASPELKTIEQIRREKRIKENKKVSNSPQLRKKKGRQAKEER